MGRSRKDDELIRILRNKTVNNNYQIVSNNILFKNEYLVCNISHDRIKIRLAGIDDSKNVRKSSKDGISRRISISYHYMDLPLGDLFISKEFSTEDQLVIFLKQ
jgi:hypothetical protein